MSRASRPRRRVSALALAAFAVACGGTDAGRPTEGATTAGSPEDPGSGPVACEAANALELSLLDDFELGAAAGGWSSNNEVCADCEDAERRLGRGPFAPDGGAADASATATPLGDAERARLEEQLTTCKAACAAAQSPAKLEKPLHAEANVGAPRCGSRYALHVRGGPFSKWGGKVELELGAPLDASAWTGVAFWARAAPGSRSAVRVEVTEKHTSGEFPFYGPARPFCAQDGSPDDTHARCDAFGASVLLERDYRLFLIPFSEMLQGGWGKRAPAFDTGGLLSLRFTYGPGPWDLWIDDVALYRPSAR